MLDTRISALEEDLDEVESSDEEDEEEEKVIIFILILLSLISFSCEIKTFFSDMTPKQDLKCGGFFLSVFPSAVGETPDP